jgi:N-acetyl-anhydromuramyl-L-alanine amidase AmpD
MPPEAVKYIVIHCSATGPTTDIGVTEIERWHRERGFLRIGYHFVIRRDGTVERGRPLNMPGAHAVGFNNNSVAVCWVGGVDAQSKVRDNRTREQIDTLRLVVTALTRQFPGAQVVGHRDLSPDRNGDGVISPNEWLKGCPSFDVKKWWESAKPQTSSIT